MSNLSIIRFSTSIVLRGLLLLAVMHAFAAQCCGQCQINQQQPSTSAIDRRFGRSVGLDGDWAVASVSTITESGMPSPAIRIFHFDVETQQWRLHQTIVSPTGSTVDGWGNDVAISGNAIIVSAQFDDERAADAGSVYVYWLRPESHSWGLEAKLTADDGFSGEALGTSIDIEGNTVIAGTLSTSRIYIFRRTAAEALSVTTWHLEQSIVGPRLESFGLSVAVCGDRAVVSGYRQGCYCDPSPPGVGLIYVYRRNQSASWVLDSTIQRTDAGPDYWFGYDVAIDGDRVVGGFIRTTAFGRGVVSSGIYQQSPNGTDWVFEGDVTATADTDLLLANRWLSISGDRLAIGDPYSHKDGHNGSVDVFEYSPRDATWVHSFDLQAPHVQTSTSRFGLSLCVDGSQVIVGAPEMQSVDAVGGHVHFFDVSGADCNANGVCDLSDIEVGASPDANHNGIPDECEKLLRDVNHDGVINIDDLAAVIVGWGTCPQPPASCSADLNGTGAVDIDDLVLVITHWSEQ